MNLSERYIAVLAEVDGLGSGELVGVATVG